MAKSGGKDAAREAEKLLAKMHKLYEQGDLHVKPNVVTYGAVIDAYAKSGEKHAAARADALLAKMIHLHQIDPTAYSDLSPNTYVFNTVINAHAKSKEVRIISSSAYNALWPNIHLTCFFCSSLLIIARCRI